MTRQFSDRGIEFERFPAIDAKQPNPELEAFHQDERRSKLGLGEVACLLSHFGAWDAFLNSSATFALIFEDDVHVKEDISAFLSEMVDLLDPEEICVHRLETVGARITLERHTIHKVGVRTCHKLISNHAGGAAYILNRRTVESFQPKKHLVRNAIDIEMFDPERRTFDTPTIYQWLPSPCIQDMHYGHQQGLKSNVRGTRWDEQTGKMEYPDGMKAKLKSVLRPFYTAAYDLALRPKGKMRKHAKFG